MKRQNTAYAMAYAMHSFLIKIRINVFADVKPSKNLIENFIEYNFGVGLGIRIYNDIYSYEEFVCISGIDGVLGEEILTKIKKVYEDQQWDIGFFMWLDRILWQNN